MPFTTTDACTQITAMLERCKTIQPKFAPGTSQYTLLKNRIQALEAACALLQKQQLPYSLLTTALPPIASVLHKCEKAQAKYQKEDGMYRRLQPQILALRMAQNAMQAAIDKQKPS